MGFESCLIELDVMANVQHLTGSRPPQIVKQVVIAILLSQKLLVYHAMVCRLAAKVDLQNVLAITDVGQADCQS